MLSIRSVKNTILFFQVRLAALKVVQELNHKLGEEYLTLLPEIIPFLAELMEGKYFIVLKTYIMLLMFFILVGLIRVTVPISLK
jgi:hypothetical protein